MEISLATPNDLPDCLRIRHDVFIDEQAVPPAIERDEYDATALHFIARIDDQPVGTARVVLKDGGRTAKIGRVAVLKPARGSGIGRAMMLAIESSPALDKVQVFTLGAQTHALAFYERLGYVAEGPEFMDADIPHRTMTKRR
jgi:predicted GNAT family N-acyltransferase